MTHQFAPHFTPPPAGTGSAAVARAIDSTRLAGGRRAKMRSHVYEQVIDLMFAHPGISLTDIAAKIGKTSAYMSHIVHSDAFKALYSERRAERTTSVDETITDLLSDVAVKALGHLSTTLRDNPEKLTLKGASELASMSLERLGYGVAPIAAAPGVAINHNTINLSAATPEDLERARALIRAGERAATAAIVPPGPHASSGMPLTQVAAATPHPANGAASEPSLASLLGFDEVEDIEVIG